VFCPRRAGTASSGSGRRLSRRRRGLSGAVRPDLRATQGDISDRELPDRRAGRTSGRVRQLRASGTCLQFVPQPPLPEVSKPGEA
jgi:hypothetical protein